MPVSSSCPIKHSLLQQNAITETLRMYPSVPFNVRMALHDTTLPTGGGTYPFTSPIGILKDTAIAYSTLTLHRRDEFFSFSHQSTGHVSPSPASTFDPDRWLADWRPKDNYTYIPFNAGPRVCIGQEFALLETKYTAVRVLQKIAGLEMRMRESEQWLNTAVVMQSGGGVKVAIVETEVS
jgi:cytochrome P450